MMSLCLGAAFFASPVDGRAPTGHVEVVQAAKGN